MKKKNVVVFCNIQTNEAIVEEITSSISLDTFTVQPEVLNSLGSDRTEISINPLDSKFDAGLLNVSDKSPENGKVISRSIAGVDTNMEANIIENLRSIRGDHTSIKIIGYLFTVT